MAKLPAIRAGITAAINMARKSRYFPLIGFPLPVLNLLYYYFPQPSLNFSNFSKDLYFYAINRFSSPWPTLFQLSIVGAGVSYGWIKPH